MIHPSTPFQDDTAGAAAEKLRRRNLLNLLLLCTFLAATAMWAFLRLPHERSVLTPAEADILNAATGLTIAAVVVVFGIGRWISVDLASAIFVCLLVLVGAVSDTPEQVSNGRSLIFFAIPVLVAGLILPPWTTFVAAGACSAAIYVVGRINGDSEPAVPSIMILFFVALVAWLFTRSIANSNAKLHAALLDLSRRETDFRMLFADNPLPMCVTRASDMQMIEVNDAAIRHYGYSRGEFLKLTVPDVMVTSTTDPVSSSGLPTVWPYHGEQRHRTKSGDVIDVQISAHRISAFGDDSILFVAQDITDRKRAEAQRDLLARVVNDSPVSTVIMDSDGIVVFVNRAFQELTGTPSEKVVGHSWWMLRPENADPEMARAIEQTVLQGGVWRTDFDGVYKNGSYARVSLSVWALRDPSGRVTNLLSMSEDITARYTAERSLHKLTAELEQRVAQRTAELERANRDLERSSHLKDDFLATMSHELRTPLTGIIGGADALLEDVYGPLTQRQTRTVQLIHRSGNHLLDVINSILDLSKIEAGGMALDLQQVNVRDLCVSSMQLVSAQAEAMAHTVSYSCSPENLMVEADPKRLKQILINLLNNAVKFTPKEGRIRLEVNADAAAEQVIFTVTDTGVGISAEDQQRLFQPFVQLDSGLNRAYAGTGLGLALVRRLAEMHAGGVGVDSTLGQGSRFWVTLPWRPTEKRTNAALDADEPLDSTNSQSFRDLLDHQPRILLAEDSPETIEIVRDCLMLAGCEVMTVTNGAQVVRTAEAGGPDLILMDIQMPFVDGIEAIQQIRMNSEPTMAATPIIALTALAMRGDRERCMAAGANAYLTKPFTVRTLLSTVQELLITAARAR